MKYQIKHRYTGAVLFECDLPDDTPSGMAVRLSLEKATVSESDLSDADLRGANLSGADLSGADLSDANLSDANLRYADLSDAKNDFWDILLRAQREIPGLRAALVAGKVNGSTYEGECACLVGTIANVRDHADFRDLGNGIKPNSNRPAERWFLGINTGDTPKTNQISAITVEWLDEFVSLLESAKVTA